MPIQGFSRNDSDSNGLCNKDAVEKNFLAWLISSALSVIGFANTKQTAIESWSMEMGTISSFPSLSNREQLRCFFKKKGPASPAERGDKWRINSSYSLRHSIGGKDKPGSVGVTSTTTFDFGWVKLVPPSQLSDNFVTMIRAYLLLHGRGAACVWACAITDNIGARKEMMLKKVARG